VPRDGRIILAFDMPWLWISEKYKMQIENSSLFTGHEIGLQEKVELRMKNLKRFDEVMRDFGEFAILDSDPSKLEIGPAVYRHGFTTAQMNGERDERFSSHDYYPATKRDAYRLILGLKRTLSHILPRSWSRKDIFLIIFHCIVTKGLLHGEELCT
jgi:hypothetical protein